MADAALAAKLAESNLWAEDVNVGTHTRIWGSWYDKEQQSWGFACCRGLKKKRLRCPATVVPGEDAHEEANEELEVRVSRRVANLLDQCPCFSGDVPTCDQEKDWTDLELRNFFFSNGLIRPARRRGEQKSEPTADDWKVLEIDVGADAAMVKKAYRRLALLHHPDKHQGNKAKDRASERFKRVAEAYEAVSGHQAEIPALAAAEGDALKRRRWRLVIVE
eukprot:TRINITY_DN50090_c0_g1_i1.p1 TRINITY_DN50090_c0_g1~~TRINITY_DN50090_c0_g1_i1.p1  ORF type:complete len:220 (+),score=45.83 TRINITY_DN50090_c0_g1_i1:220-879(+)